MSAIIHENVMEGMLPVNICDIHVSQGCTSNISWTADCCLQENTVHICQSHSRQSVWCNIVNGIDVCDSLHNYAVNFKQNLIIFLFRGLSEANFIFGKTYER